MPKSFKFKNNMYLDSKGIVHNKTILSDFLPKLSRHYDMEKASEINLNNYVTPGRYYIGNKYTNAPLSSTIFGVLIVITSRYYSWNKTDQSNWIWQIILDTSGNIFIRNAANDSFTNWKRIQTGSI